MRRTVWRRVRSTLAVLLVYFLSLGACIAAILAVPYLCHADFLNRESDRLAEEYARTGLLGKDGLYGMGVLIYDRNGICIDGQMPRDYVSSAQAETVFGPHARPLVPRTLGGRRGVRVVLLPSQSVGALLVSKPICRDGRVDGAFVLIRDLYDLHSTLISVCFTYTLVFLLAAACFCYTMYKKGRYVQLQREYVANVTHDLKSPISSVRALTETLRAGLVEDEETRRKYYDFIFAETAELQRTVADILELSAMQSGQTTLPKRAGYLNDALAPIWEKYGVLCGEKGIHLHISDSLRQLPPVYTHFKSVARLLDLLLDNAVKFVEADGQIWVSCAVNGRRAVLCVRDNGAGITKEALPHVFERFFKGGHDFNESGSGLGLAIAKEIAAGLKERIWVESESGQGTAFYFTVHLK